MPRGFWNEHFHRTALIITIYFLRLPPALSHLYPLQKCRNSRLVVDEDDNGKFRLERAYLSFKLTDCLRLENVLIINS